MKDSSHDEVSLYDWEAAQEIARLQLLHGLLMKFALEPFPPLGEAQMRRCRQVLDLGCGPGGWALDLATYFPHLQVVVLDTSQRALDVARQSAQQRGLESSTRLTLLEGDICEPFPFADETFDLVHLRLLQAVLPRARWQAIIQECRRVLRPGGHLLWCEADLIRSSCSAFERLTAWYLQGLAAAGYGASVDGRSLDLLAALAPLLRESGFVEVRLLPAALDLSAGTPAYTPFVQYARLLLQGLPAWLERQGVTSCEEAGVLMQQTLEILEHDAHFCGIWLFLSVSGRVPEQDAPALSPAAQSARRGSPDAHIMMEVVR